MGGSKLTEYLRRDAIVPQRDSLKRNLARYRAHQVVQPEWFVGSDQRRGFVVGRDLLAIVFGAF